MTKSDQPATNRIYTTARPVGPTMDLGSEHGLKLALHAFWGVSLEDSGKATHKT